MMTEVTGKSQKFLQNFFFQQTGHGLRKVGRTMKVIPNTIRRGWEPTDAQLSTFFFIYFFFILFLC
jgi:hypothetical protein